MNDNQMDFARVQINSIPNTSLQTYVQRSVAGFLNKIIHSLEGAIGILRGGTNAPSHPPKLNPWIAG